MKSAQSFCLPTKTSLANVPDSTRSLLSRTSRESSPLLPVSIPSSSQDAFTRKRPFGGSSPDASTPPLFLDVNIEVTEDRKPEMSRFQKIRRKVSNFVQFEWKQNLLKVSNYASILCVLDCTVLPLVTIVLPLFGVVAGTKEQMDFLHSLGHTLACYFVLPVGGLATATNYFYSHRKRWIAAMGSAGLMLVLLANGGASCGHHHHHHVVESVPRIMQIMNAVHHGILHRVINLSGCALLLGSNYISHRVAGCGCKDPDCKI